MRHLQVQADLGNGFLFETYNAEGLAWAIDQAMQFFGLPAAVREPQITRIMQESAARFTHSVNARQYIELYERMLNRPLVRR